MNSAQGPERSGRGQDRPSGGNRRDFICGVVGTAATGWVAAHLPGLQATAAYAATVAPEAPWEFFTPDQAREFDAISAQIVPTDETPGAREAHVVRFVDRFLGTVAKNEQPRMQELFKLLGDAVEKKTPGSRSFAALNDADQIALLTDRETSQRNAFNNLLDYTMLGMFAHPMHGGNFNKVGWKLIGYQDRYAWAPPFGYDDHV